MTRASWGVMHCRLLTSQSRTGGHDVQTGSSGHVCSLLPVIRLTGGEVQRCLDEVMMINLLERLSDDAGGSPGTSSTWLTGERSAALHWALRGLPVQRNVAYYPVLDSAAGWLEEDQGFQNVRDDSTALSTPVLFSERPLRTYGICVQIGTR